MAFGHFVVQHRDLRHREKYIRKLECRKLCRFVVIPHDHIRVDCGVSAGHSKRKGIHSVSKTVIRAVGRTYHISEGTHERSHISLSEFDKYIGIELCQLAHNILHKTVYCVIYRNIIHAFLNGISLMEGIYKVELEAIKSPIYNSILVCIDQILSDIRVSRVKDICTVHSGLRKHLIFETLICL